MAEPEIAMNEQYRCNTQRTRLLGLLALLGLLSSAVACAITGQTRPLLPILPSPTALPNIVDSEAIELTFAELNADPSAYRAQRLRVTGSFVPQEPEECPRNANYTGPDIRWALINDNLQMDARGFERLVPLIDPGQTMTVEGIWRLYQGPLGCGKEPERGTAWYLETTRIVEPSTFLIVGEPGILVTPMPAGEDGTAEPEPTATGDESATPALPTPDGTLATPTIGIPSGGQPATPTRTPLPTPTTSGETAVPAPTDEDTTPETPSTPITGTPPAGTPTVTYTAEPPGVVTSTPGGYPGQPSPTPQPTTNPYP